MALMSGPSYGGIGGGVPAEKERRVNVHFRLPYMTKWGQSIVLAGSGAWTAHDGGAVDAVCVYVYRCSYCH